MEDWSTRIISVMPCTLESMERDHLRIQGEGFGEKFNLELVSLRILAGARACAPGEQEATQGQKARGARRPTGQGETRVEGVISVRADEMSAETLELKRDVVKNLAERTSGTMMISTEEFQFLVFEQGKDKIFNMILEISGTSE